MSTTNSTQEKHVLNLPILKHFDVEKGEIILDAKAGLKGGQRALFLFLALAVFGGLGYLTWTYILPPLLTAFGQALAFIGVALLVVFVILMMPVIMKSMRRLTRFLHGLVIKADPFGELEEQKEKMYQNRKTFKEAKAKIKAIKSNMEIEAAKAEKDAKDYQEQVLSAQVTAKKLKDAMDAMIQKDGIAAKDTDEYVQLDSQLMKKLSDSQRIVNQLDQSKSFVQKYGSRANIMGKLDRKLTMAETAIDIKISDFETTIVMLKKEYEFAKHAKSATESAKSAMLFTKEWELEYALDVVSSTIAQDIARTQENLTDIDSLTSKYSMDSDELYSRLDQLSDKIKTGNDVIPDAKKYSNPNHKLTAEDKQASGGFTDIFD